MNECDGTAGVIVRVWTAVDECGNESTCEQIITVIDDEIPNLICPPDVTLNCDQETDPSIAGGSAIAADNCTSTENITITFADRNGGTLSDCGGNAGVIIRVWTAVDACGNEATCEQIITVVDESAPVISCVADITVSCDADQTPAATGEATATDNCSDAANISITFTDQNGGSLSDCGGTAGSFIRVWTAVDECGNETTCEQIITVIDDSAPILDCPADLTLSCDEERAPSATGEASATDNCTATGDITITFADSNGGVLADCGGNSGVILRTWTAVDACGNETTCAVSYTHLTLPTIYSV